MAAILLHRDFGFESRSINRLCYTCSHGDNGHNQTCNKCAQATTVDTVSSGGCRAVGDSARSAGTRAASWAGRASEAIWIKPGTGEGGPETTRSRRTRCLLSASRCHRSGVDGRRRRGSVSDKTLSRKHSFALGRSEDERGRPSPSRDGIRPNRRGSRFHAYGGAELGISRESVPAVRFVAFARNDSGTEHEHAALSACRIHRTAIETTIADPAQRDPRRLSDTRFRGSRRSTGAPFIRVINLHRFSCAADRRGRSCREFELTKAPVARSIAAALLLFSLDLHWKIIRTFSFLRSYRFKY